jgi:hypothetical protein
MDADGTTGGAALSDITQSDITQRDIPQSDIPPYDSRADILAHILAVRDRLDVFAAALARRGSAHDASKFSDAEKPAFDLVTPLLPGVIYGSPAYQALEERVRPALEHHYQHNSHHPEYYRSLGIAGMDLFDVVEMVCDWIASVAGRSGGGLNLDFNVQRFGIDAQLASILANTLDRWPRTDDPGIRLVGRD